jgi:hypothetical protein
MVGIHPCPTLGTSQSRLGILKNAFGCLKQNKDKKTSKRDEGRELNVLFGDGLNSRIGTKNMENDHAIFHSKKRKATRLRWTAPACDCSSSKSIGTGKEP